MFLTNNQIQITANKSKTSARIIAIFREKNIENSFLIWHFSLNDYVPGLPGFGQASFNWTAFFWFEPL